MQYERAIPYTGLPSKSQFDEHVVTDVPVYVFSNIDAN